MDHCILIDDDELVFATWKYRAESKNINLHYFSNTKQFLKKEKNLKRDWPVFLDSQIGSEIGEEFIPKLNELGFYSISIVTGKSPAEITQNIHLIKEIRGKEPPF